MTPVPAAPALPDLLRLGLRLVPGGVATGAAEGLAAVGVALATLAALV